MKILTFLLSFVLSFGFVVLVFHFIEGCEKKDTFFRFDLPSDCLKTKEKCAIFFTKKIEIAKKGYTAEINKEEYVVRENDGTYSLGTIQDYILKLESDFFSFSLLLDPRNSFYTGAYFVLKSKNLNFKLDQMIGISINHSRYHNCENSALNEKGFQCVYW